MKITGEQLLPQPQDLVWDSLNDPKILKACILGCESIELLEDNKYTITLLAAVGPFKARFTGQLAVSDIQAPSTYRLIFNGSGGAIGFGKGSAQVTLCQQDGGTLLQYESSARVEGKLAQIGSRLIDAAAKKIANDFFEKFRIELAQMDQTRVPTLS